MDPDKVLDSFFIEDQDYSSQIENFIVFPLLEEINTIEDENIRHFVRSLLSKACIAFWGVPSSEFFGVHPPDEYEDGGNVLHIQRVFRIAEKLCVAYALEPWDRDLVYAACLVHDITKVVLSEDGETITFDPFHAYTIDAFVKDVYNIDFIYGTDAQSSVLYLKQEVIQEVLRMVHCHDGQDSIIQETKPASVGEMIVHIANDIAKNLHYIIDGETIKEARWNIAEI